MTLLHDKHDEPASTPNQRLMTSLKFKVGQVIKKIAKLVFLFGCVSVNLTMDWKVLTLSTSTSRFD